MMNWKWADGLLIRLVAYSWVLQCRLDKEECKKPNSIILVNLISPRIDYKSQGKSEMDCLPFAKTIAKTIGEACKGGNDRDGRKYRIEALREVLTKRKQEYLAIQDPIERENKDGHRVMN